MSDSEQERSEERLRTAVRALGGIAQLAGSVSNPTELFERGTREICRAFGAKGATVFLFNPERTALVPLYAIGSTPEEQATFARVPLEESITYRVAMTRAPEAWLVDEYPGSARTLMAQTPYHAVASAPLQVQSRVLGALNLGFLEPVVLTPEELELLGVIAAHFAAALEVSRLAGRQAEAESALDRAGRDLRESTAELARLQGKLLERERLAALGEMAATLAHEIRNPLAVLTNALAVLVQRPQSPGLQGMMRAEVDRMTELSEELLEFSRPRPALLRPTELPPVLEEVVAAAGAQAPAGVRIALEVRGTLPEVNVDVRLLRRAVLNLLQNGAQATASGTVTLRASASEVRLLLEVEDEGPGIPPEEVERIFEPFYSRRAAGTGLGLALVKRAVDEHRGEISVGPGATRGARFALSLPL